MTITVRITPDYPCDPRELLEYVKMRLEEAYSPDLTEEQWDALDTVALTVEGVEG